MRESILRPHWGSMVPWKKEYHFDHSKTEADKRQHNRDTPYTPVTHWGKIKNSKSENRKQTNRKEKEGKQDKTENIVKKKNKENSV